MSEYQPAVNDKPIKGHRGSAYPAHKVGWLGLLFLLVSLFAQGSGYAQTTGSITISAGSPGVAISPTLYGAFFEEINYAGEGGLYGELVRNRSFSNSTSPDYWSLVTSSLTGWAPSSGSWSIDTSVSPGAYSQSATTTDCRSTFSIPGSSAWQNYTLTLRARKIGGSEGFLVMFNVVDSNNWFRWNIGGWGNTYHAVQYSINGVQTTGPRVSGSVTTGQWYDIKIVIQGNTISCYLDNVLTQTFTSGSGYVGGIGLSTWSTQAEYRNIVVTGSDSQVLYQSDFDSSSGTMSVDTSNPLNATNPAALKLTMLTGTGRVGVGNSGFWGIPLQSGSTYDLSLYASGTAGFAGPLTVRLESADGNTLYAQASFNGLTTDWQHFTATLTPAASDANARIVVSMAQAGTVWLDEVSLFPHATYQSRTNGLRLDLANMLAAMKPNFLRFPGGNFIESNTIANAVRWKKTIGDPATRPGHLNDSWGYWTTDGYGLDEFFRQCEDMGMEPLYDINAGLMLGYNGGSTNTVPIAEMGPWVQDALDLIEYANGDTSTTWGALRAANGHPASYHLKYMEIGNENGGSYYDARYTLFYDAIKAKYPDIHLIACGNWSGGPPTSRAVEIKDEHYYSSPATFISYATKYDSYSRSGSKVFVGEYAVTSGYGTYGNLSAALGEAAFMTGMERNSDIVVMASYAPLFANVNGIQWHPDLIYYDNYRLFGTPSYYVQKMFANNTGSAVLPTTQSFGSSGSIGLSTWNTQSEYRNIVVTDSDSNPQVLYQSDFATGTTGWTASSGTWAVDSAVSPGPSAYGQSGSGTDCRSTYSATGSSSWNNYTLTLQARKTGGSEGFLILFNVADANNWVWWNLGGWGNTTHAIEYSVNGAKATAAQVTGSIVTGTWYNIRIVVQGGTASCYLDNVLTQTVTLPSPVYSVTSLKESTREIILKSVNPTSGAVTASIVLNGISAIAPTARKTLLTSASVADENSLTVPDKVVPVTSTVSTPSPQFALTLPAYSATILRMQGLPSAPQNITVTAGNQRAVINWGGTAGAATYTVTRSTVSGGPYTAVASGITATGYTDTGLTNGITYYYVVVAVNSAGGTVANGQTDATPVLPPITTQELGGTAVAIAGNDIKLTVKSSVSGRIYQLQCSDSLAADTWQNVGSPTTGTGDDLIFYDSYDTAIRKRFYRVRLSSP
jgi:alpha-L-arabinofuranosidase